MKERVIVLGSVNTDLVVKVRRLPRPGETVIGGTFYQNQGGKGANQAVAAARSGEKPVTLIAAVGHDVFGRESLVALQRDKIDLTHVKVKDGVSSGVALIMVDEDGENAIAVASGANTALSPADVNEVPDSVFESAAVLLTCFEIPVETVRAGICRARQFGVTTILNPAPVPEELPADLFSDVDIMTPNEHEIARLLDLPQIEDEAGARTAAKRLLDRGVRNVILTLGARGCFFAGAEGTGFLPAFQVKAVDTTGAGDAFNGALAAAISEGRDWEDSLRWASAAAAISVTRAGAQPSMPFRKEIEDFLKIQG
uniref:Ribokinase n=1 Tax=uncultured Planctomycetota bacterium TaxID=120965 RepID=H5SDM9_9BACT|nr:ribokinase [uncultured Planctomycetota bacterium]